MLRQDPATKRYSAEIKHRTFGRVHLHLKTTTKSIAITRHAALEQLLDTGEPVADIVAALRAQKLTIQAVTECVRSKQPFDTLRASTWPTLGAAIEAYVMEQRQRDNGSHSTANSSSVALKHASAFFGNDRSIESITYDEVTAYKAYLRTKGLQDNTVVLYLIKFGALFTYLQRRETRRALQQRRPPATLVSPVDRDEHVPAKTKTRVRFLSEPEAARMLLVSPASLVAATALGLFAGLRIGEVDMLRPIDIDLERSMLYIQAREGWKPKYGRNREVPISTALEPYLRAHLEALPVEAPYLFGGRSDGTPVGRSKLFQRYRRIVDDAGLSRDRRDPHAVSFHTLRHTFASWLVMAGADLFTVARLMGHTSTKQLEETYAHLSPQHRLATVELLAARWLSRATRRADIAPQSVDTTGDTTDG
jgi:integrase